MTVFSIIDIGSHSVRGLVAKCTDNDGPVVLSESRVTTRLGEGLERSGCLSNEAMERALIAISLVHQKAMGHSASCTRAVATCAVREARNGSVFVHRVESETDLKVEVLSAEEEVRLSHRGIIDMGRASNDQYVVADLGGGSLEIMLAHGSEIQATFLTKLGAIRITEKFNLQDPVSQAREETVTKYIHEMLLRSGLPAAQEDRQLIVCGGSALANAALIANGVVNEQELNSASHLWHGSEVMFDELLSTLNKLKMLDTKQRAIATGLSADRAAVIVAGALTLVVLMDRLGSKSYVLGAYGIRGGILAEMLSRSD